MRKIIFRFLVAISLSILPLTAAAQDVACAISPKAGLDPLRLKQVTDSLIARGTIRQILDRYQGS